MSKNHYSSAHFFPKVRRVDKLPNNSDSNRDMARSREGFLQNLIGGSSKMPSFKYLSSNLSRTILWMESITPSSELKAVSSEQDMKHGIPEDSHAKDSIFTEQQSTSGLLPRIRPRDGSSKCALCTAQNQAIHGADTSFKHNIVSNLSRSRAERHAHERSKSGKPIQFAHTDTYYDNTKPAPITQRSRKLPLQTSHIQSDISNQNYAQPIDKTISPWIFSDATRIYSQTTTESPINILYHDFMKEISLPHNSPELSFQRIYPARSTFRNLNPLKHDLITLPAFTVDPSDLTEDGSLKKRNKTTSFLPKTHKNSLHNSTSLPLLTNKQHLSSDILSTTGTKDDIANYPPQHHQPLTTTQHNPPLTPPMTPATSCANSTSTSRSRAHSVQRHPRHCLSSSIPSLNSSHQHTLLLLSAKDPSRRTSITKSPPSSKRSRSCSTRMSSSYSSCYSKVEKEESLMVATPSNSNCKTNSIDARSLPSLSDVSHLSLSPSVASVMEDTAAIRADNPAKESESPASLLEEQQQQQQQSQPSNTNQIHQHPDLPIESPPHALTSKDNEPIIPPQAPPTPNNQIIPTNQKTHRQQPSTDSIFKPCSPPPAPIERSRPIPRLLHPAPWLEQECGEDGDEEGSLKVPYAQSWTEVWAVNDRHTKWKWTADGRRGKNRGSRDKVRDGLRRVLGRS